MLAGVAGVVEWACLALLEALFTIHAWTAIAINGWMPELATGVFALACPTAINLAFVNGFDITGWMWAGARLVSASDSKPAVCLDSSWAGVLLGLWLGLGLWLVDVIFGVRVVGDVVAVTDLGNPDVGKMRDISTHFDVFDGIFIITQNCFQFSGRFQVGFEKVNWVCDNIGDPLGWNVVFGNQTLDLFGVENAKQKTRVSCHAKECVDGFKETTIKRSSSHD